MKKFFGLLALMLLFTGCSSASETTTTICKGNIDELTYNTTTIESVDDQVNTMSAVVEYDLTGYFSETEDADYWIAQLKSINVDYDSLKGVKANWEVDGEIITLTVDINYEEADMDELAEAEMITQTEEGEIAYISLEETINQQESAGLTCKEQEK